MPHHLRKFFWNSLSACILINIFLAIAFNVYCLISKHFYFWISGENTDAAKTEICKLDSDEGSCKNSHQRWHYNAAQGTCVLFNWGGCAGNRWKYIFDKPTYDTRYQMIRIWGTIFLDRTWTICIESPFIRNRFKTYEVCMDYCDDVMKNGGDISSHPNGDSGITKSVLPDSGR